MVEQYRYFHTREGRRTGGWGTSLRGLARTNLWIAVDQSSLIHLIVCSHYITIRHISKAGLVLTPIHKPRRRRNRRFQCRWSWWRRPSPAAARRTPASRRDYRSATFCWIEIVPTWTYSWNIPTAFCLLGREEVLCAVHGVLRREWHHVRNLDRRHRPSQGNSPFRIRISTFQVPFRVEFDVWAWSGDYTEFTFTIIISCLADGQATAVR